MKIFLFLNYWWVWKASNEPINMMVSWWNCKFIQVNVCLSKFKKKWVQNKKINKYKGKKKKKSFHYQDFKLVNNIAVEKQSKTWTEKERNLIPSFSITQYIFNNLHIEGVERSSTRYFKVLKGPAKKIVKDGWMQFTSREKSNPKKPHHGWQNCAN